MFEPTLPPEFLDPEDRKIWLQEPENGGRRLPGFGRLLRVQEDVADSVYSAWYRHKEALDLPKRILHSDFWPSKETAFKKNYPSEIELAYFEEWPSFEADSVELTEDILTCKKLRMTSTTVADQLTFFYKLHQTKIDLMMIRFNVSKLFELGDHDWLDELEMDDKVQSEKLDSLFFSWRIDDPKLHQMFEFLGEKRINASCRFFNYFFEGILKSGFAKASLRVEEDGGDQGGENSDSAGHPKKPKNEGPQP
jgi:hypothetical protein